MFLDRVSKKYGDFVAVDNISLNLDGKEFVAVVGPSGCGKTTLLRLICGLEKPTSGRIDRSDVAYVFQEPALFPHMNVFDNIAFGLKIKKTPLCQIAERVNEVASALGIADKLGEKPRALSGGQRQRAAIGRAIVMRPKICLFDEPLSGLDEALKDRIYDLITELYETNGSTFLYVTHNVAELRSATKVAVMDRGKLLQFGSPKEVYSDPHNAFVGGFVGKMNFFEGNMEGGKLYVSDFCLPFRHEFCGSVKVGIRPEDIKVAKSGIAAKVECPQFPIGFRARLSSGESAIVYDDPAGERVHLWFDPRKIYLFTQNGERIWNANSES